MPGLFPWGARKREEPAAATIAAAGVPRDDRDVEGAAEVSGGARASRRRRPCSISGRSSAPTSRSSATGWRCQFRVEDCTSDIEAQARRGTRDGLWQAISSAAHVADAGLVRRHPVLGRLRLSRPRRPARRWPRGWPSCCGRAACSTASSAPPPVDLTHYTRFVVEDQSTFRQRPYPATPVRRNVLVTRDITRMFDPLAVTESVLLKTQHAAKRCSANRPA